MTLLLLCLYSAHPDTFLASNSVLQSACSSFSNGENKYFLSLCHYFINIVNVKILSLNFFSIAQLKLNSVLIIQ